MSQDIEEASPSWDTWYIGDYDIELDDILVVHSREQSGFYRQFDASQVYTIHSLPFLGGKRPLRVFRTRLGVSRHAWDMHEYLEELVADHGTELYHVYEDGQVLPA